MDTLRLREVLIQEDGDDYIIPLDSFSEIQDWTTDLEKALSTKATELAKANRILAEKERLLAVFHQIGQVTLSSLDLDQVLDNLIDQIIKSGIFRSFMIALVDEQSSETRIVRTFARRPMEAEQQTQAVPRRVGRRVKDEDIVAEVARLGTMAVIERRGTEATEQEWSGTERRHDKVFYYIPVKKEARVLAVLGTDSSPNKKTEMLERIDIMRPLLDQVAIALEHAETTRKLEEAQIHLIQADKMASLGQLAAGVAHEINNPVGFVGSNIETLTEYIDVFKQLIASYEALSKQLGSSAAPECQQHLKRIEALWRTEEVSYLLKDADELLKESQGGISRVTEIVQGLKSFARLDGGELEMANINDGILETLKIVWNELKYKCHIYKDLGNIPSIPCYPGQLKQVFMNLLTNAAQAIDERGEITIKTEATQTHLVVRIADTGAGIPEEIQQRIFEPFFTTKPVGQGTGLGLAISYGIIQAHKGRIAFETVENQGTEFIVELPLKRDLPS